MCEYFPCHLIFSCRKACRNHASGRDMQGLSRGVRRAWRVRMRARAKALLRHLRGSAAPSASPGTGVLLLGRAGASGRLIYSDLPPPLQLLHGREALLPPKAILYLAVETAPREGFHVSAPPHLSSQARSCAPAEKLSHASPGASASCHGDSL